MWGEDFSSTADLESPMFLLETPYPHSVSKPHKFIDPPRGNIDGVKLCLVAGTLEWQGQKLACLTQEESDHNCLL